MSKVYCLYHSADTDGHLSGALVKYYENSIGNEVELKGVNYGKGVDTDSFDAPEGSVVYVVDFSIAPMEKFVEFAKKYKVIWIDHHLSAIDDWVKLSNEDKKVLSGDYVTSGYKAACRLVWEYFNSIKANPILPAYVELCSDYDIWNKTDLNKWENSILPFQMGIRSSDTDPVRNYEFWELFFNSGEYLPNKVATIISRGQTILSYQRRQDEHSCKSKSYVKTFEGKTWIVMNGGVHNSNTFLSVYDPSKHDGMIQYTYTGKGYWTVSLYTTKDDVDCSEISKKYGGGGHKQAAGFQRADIGVLL